MADTQIHKGLAGVVVDTSTISMVDPVSNSLLYRGYPAEQLADKASIEQVAYLLWNGELPTESELADFSKTERSYRAIPQPVAQALAVVPLSAHPMDVCRTAVSVLGTLDETLADESEDANRDRSLRMFALMPSVIAWDQRRRRGLEPLEPRDDLGFAANLLFMTFGEVPAADVVRAFEISLIMYAEHSLNASTFAGRVIASTLADIYSAVTGAIGALKGRLHGGANQAVMDVFAEVGTPDNVDAWLDEALGAKRIVMGFGHRVYKNGDSRVPIMKSALDDLIKHYDRPDVADLYEALEKGMYDRTKIQPNLDYVTGPAYDLIGFDIEMFTPLFVVARMIGWTAHIMEQYSANALIRPLAQYVGPERRDVP